MCPERVEGKRYLEHITHRRAHREISHREISAALTGHEGSGPGGEGIEQGKLESEGEQDMFWDVWETQLHSRSAPCGL